MNPVVDTIMIVLFVIFMIWLVHGFVRTQYDKKVVELEKKDNDENKSSN